MESQQNRRDVLKKIAAIAAAGTIFPQKVSALSGLDKPNKHSLPNIVLFLADDLGYGDLGCYGNKIIKTPNIDRFAKEGMAFSDAHAAAPVCSPARSGILTGRTPYRNGVYTWIPENGQVHLRSSEISIAKLLKQKDYNTCHLGKWHLNGKFNSPDQPQPNDHGFDYWMATQNNASPCHKDPVNFVRNGEALGKIEGYSSDILAHEATRWLRKKWDKSKPFFLNVWTHEPHVPIETDPKFMAMYPNIKKPSQKQHHGNITQIDHSFGMLLRNLADMGVADNTIVIFTSDNGPAGFGQGKTTDADRRLGSTGGLRQRKGVVYEGGIRVPFIVRWPGKIKQNTRSNQPVNGTDIFSTICDIAQIASPDDRTIDGAAITLTFDNKKLNRKIPMYWRHKGKIAVRKENIKIIANEDMTDFEMFDLEKDITESQNLIASQPEKFEAMKKLMIELNKQITDEGPDWWKRGIR